MISTTISVRVRYGETDKMGVVYHGNYAAYCEVARVEFFREMGLPYAELEESGIMLPVVELYFRYFKSAFYDEILDIETTLTEIPKSVRMRFEYKIYNQKKELLTEAFSVLAFVDIETRKPVKCPDYMIEKLEELIGN
jgi:acyl-CoA thioester hydrolase